MQKESGGEQMMTGLTFFCELSHQGMHPKINILSLITYPHIVPNT